MRASTTASARTNRDSASRQKRLVQDHFRDKAEFWRDIYSNNDVHAVIHQQRRNAVLSLIDGLSLPANSQILEVGCGAGSTSIALAQRGLLVTATDRVPDMTELTYRLAEEKGVTGNISLSVADVDKLEFGADAFDAVLAIGVLCWLDSYEQALFEMVRVLRPGGYLLVSTDNRWALHRLVNPRTNHWLSPLADAVSRCIQRFRPSKPGPLNTTISGARFEELLKRCGLETRKLVPIGFGPFSIGRSALFPQSFGLRVHYRLQKMCDRGVPLVGSFAAQHLFLAEKK